MLEFFLFNFCSLEVAMKRNSCLYLHHWMSTAMQVMVERYVNKISLPKINILNFEYQQFHVKLLSLQNLGCIQDNHDTNKQQSFTPKVLLLYITSK